MALVPDNWLNAPIRKAYKMGQKYFLLNKLSMAEFETIRRDRRISCISCSILTLPQRANTSLASLIRLCLISQRGLSGIINDKQKNTNDGIATIPSIQRQAFSPTFENK